MLNSLKILVLFTSWPYIPCNWIISLPNCMFTPFHFSIELTLTVSCFCIEQGNMTTESTSPKSTLLTDTIFKTRISNTSFPSTIGTRPSSSKSPGSLFNTTHLPSGRTIQHETKRGNVSILVLGNVLSDQLQNLAQQISTLLQKQNQKDVVIQSLDIVFYHNITE